MADPLQLIDPLPFEKRSQRFDFVIGNPPFIGSKMMTDGQREEIKKAFDNTTGAGVLDYVCGWYQKAAEYLKSYSSAEHQANPDIQDRTKVAFVSTNSIAQGEQVGIIWETLINKYDIIIHFAHKTFKWSNEAKGKAAVYCVIIGFSNYEISNKLIYEYEHVKAEPHEIKASNINPYLVDGKNVIIKARQNPICKVPKMSFGNMPLDGGNLLLSDTEKNELVSKNPNVSKFIKPLISAKEFLNAENRWCLWLVDANPGELREIPEVLNRIEKVKQFRLSSIAPSTQKFAATPTLFRDRQTPDSYILIPSTTSENRKYIPFGFFGKNDIANNSCHIIPDGNLFHYGIISSEMHMSWVKYVCGRLESRYRYSKDIVYNNFPWPESPTEKQIKSVEEAAQKVMDARKLFPDNSLADLYDPLTMPPALVKAHQELDKAVDHCYRPQAFVNETKRIEFLFELWEKYTQSQ